MGTKGLKLQSMINLRYKDWSSDLDLYFNLFMSLEDNIDAMRDLIAKYYDSSEIDGIMSKISDLRNSISVKKNVTLSYSYVPSKLISRYGSLDSTVMFELNDFYDKWMDKESKDLGIDISKGYEYWKEHHIAGYILERNGAYWNDDRAKEIEKWCIDGMHDSLKALIESPLSEPYIRGKLYDEFLVYIKDNYIDEILEHKAVIKRNYKRYVTITTFDQELTDLLASMSRVSDDKVVIKLELGNIETLAKRNVLSDDSIFNEWYKDYMDRYAGEEHTINEYKRLINPGATANDFKDFISDMLITDQIRYAKIYTELVHLVESPDFNIADYVDDNDVRLLSLIDKLRVGDLTGSRRLDMFMKFISKGGEFRSWRIKKAINTALNYRLKSLSALDMNELYELYLMNHIDVEDESTWTDRFRWIYNYKFYKKLSKIMSTYIEGKVGRRNVWEVDRRSLENGDELTRREKLYDDNSKNNLPSNKALLLQTDFRINMADTGRWQAGIHNLPAGDLIKSIYTSRFPGGCIMMPDGSQMEVRTLAAECKDENLLKAFKDGVDIHRFFASKIYQVPYEEVKDWQRGLAKNAVFGMIYGEGAQSFADRYMKGDISKAQEVFDGMFEGFPRIKEFIDRAHHQFEKYGKVTTLTQRFININDPRADHNKLLRQSQNYIIQGAAEDLAGLIMYQLDKFIYENGFKTKPFCFIHDSIELDAHPMEVFRMIDKVNYLFNVYPVEEFGVPVACDVPIGPSMGQEIEVEEMEHDDDFNDIIITLKGYVDDIKELLEIWNRAYRLVDVLDDGSDSYKKVYVERAKMFLPVKAAISMKAGTYRDKGTMKIHVIVR